MAKKLDSLSKQNTPTTPEVADKVVPKNEKVVAAAPAVAKPITSTPEQATPTEVATAPADSYESLFPEPTVTINPPPHWLWWLLLLLGSVGVAIAGYKLTNQQVTNWLSPTSTPSPSAAPISTASGTPSATATSAPTSTATPTATATPTPSATPSPSASPSATTIPKSSITLRVLNGTTTNGAANKMKATLEAAGFSVRTIGNANNQAYSHVTIYYQTGHLAEAQSVEQSLQKYTPDLKESSALANPDMVLVVVGSNF